MKDVFYKLLTIVFVLIVLTSCKSEKSMSNINKSKCFSVNGVNFTMIWVKGGTFLMGATPEQGIFVESDEKPVHQVTIDGFYMAETEVTQELWETVMGYNNSICPNAQNPIENVTWNDCQVFIDSLNQLTGLRFRLPTEAEWEYAARGGNKSKGYKYSGSNNVDEVAWYDDKYESQNPMKYGESHPVKTKMPNELGLYDMNGNVKEFCQDCYTEYGKGNMKKPNVNFSYCDRVIRGGSFVSDSLGCRISVRDPIEIDEQYCTLGFRLAL